MPTMVPLPAVVGGASGSVSGGGVAVTRTVGDFGATGSVTASSPSLTQDLGVSGASTSIADQDPNNVASTSLSQYHPLSADLSTSPSHSISYPTTQPTSITTQSPNAITTKSPINNNDIPSNPLPRRPRRHLIYSTAPTDDVPMSLPRHLLPGSQPRVQQRPIVVHVGEGVVTETGLGEVSASVSAAPVYSTSAGESIGGDDGSVSATATAMVTKKKLSDVVRAMFYRRQVDGGDGVGGAAGVNATMLVNATDTASDPGLVPTAGADVAGDGEVNATVTALSVSMPLEPMVMSVSTATDGSVDTGAVTTTTAMASSVSGLSLGSDVSLSTTGIESVSVTSMSLSAMATGTATDVDTDTDMPLSTMNTDVTAIATPTADTNIGTDVPIPTIIPAMNTDINTNTVADLSTNTTLSLANKLAALSPPQPTKYYAAPWHQFLDLTGIPTNIKGITCRGGLEPVGSCITPDTDGDTESCECDVEDEIWSVWSETRMRVGTTSVSFSGGVVVGGSTTVVVVGQVLTTTAMDVVGRVARRVVTSSAVGSVTVTGDGEGTVYATATSYPSVTMTLVPGDGVGMGGPASSIGAGVSSSTVDPAMQVGAAMPQVGPSSISMPTGSDMSISMPISTSMAPSISYPTGISTTGTEDLVSSVSTPAASFAGATGAGLFSPSHTERLEDELTYRV